MAFIGVSKPYYAIYDEDAQTYGTLTCLAMACNANVTVDGGGNVSKLYADNMLAEEANGVTFTGASVSIEVDNLTAAVEADLTGATLGGGDELISSTTDEAPYVGLGFIVKGQKAGVKYYQAYGFYRATFSIPDVAATTQGETTDLQTRTVEATITQQADYKWRFYKKFTTEDEAFAYIKSQFGGE